MKKQQIRKKAASFLAILSLAFGLWYHVPARAAEDASAGFTEESQVLGDKATYEEWSKLATPGQEREHTIDKYATAITDLSQLTDQAVYQILISFSEPLPEGTYWTNDDFYGADWEGGYGCHGFALMLSDAAFGDLPVRQTKDWDNIRVGDILRVNNDTHTVIVLGVNGDNITVAEANYNSSVHWGRVITRNSLKRGEGTYIESRWPEVYASGITIEAKKPSVRASLQMNRAFGSSDIEYAWYAENENGKVIYFSGWQYNNPYLDWTPSDYGDYTLYAVFRDANTSIYYSNGGYIIQRLSTRLTYHEYIKGECQMPYEGEGGGYLIGFETYENPNQSYHYEMLILDCTLLAQGLPAWTYTTGQCGVAEGNALWTIWQPQYGYYWTLFRLYDPEGNQIDEVCYGFENI